MSRVERDPKQGDVYYVRESEEEKRARLEQEDLLTRLEALEAEAKRKNAQYKVPAPPAGLERCKVTE